MSGELDDVEPAPLPVKEYPQVSSHRFLRFFFGSIVIRTGVPFSIHDEPTENSQKLLEGLFRELKKQNATLKVITYITIFPWQVFGLDRNKIMNILAAKSLPADFLRPEGENSCVFPTVDGPSLILRNLVTSIYAETGGATGENDEQR